MGLFDYIRSEMPLPDGFTGELQSKDFDCIMTTILIRADGRLMVEERDFELIPPSEDPSPDDPRSFKHWIGSVKSTHRGWKDMDYHGDFEFYGYEAAKAEGPLYGIGMLHGSPMAPLSTSKVSACLPDSFPGQSFESSCNMNDE